MTLALNYVSFTVSNMERALAFYRTLGLPLPEGAHLGTDGRLQDHTEVTVNGVRVAWLDESLARQLDEGWQPPARAARIGVAFGALTPGEVDAAVQRLRAGGYTVAAEPFDAFWGQRYATVLDPDGTPVDIFAWLPQK
ncbi:VOC family protein [Deinococcus hopiensis]|uniref:Uncharacterized conserved protein PhnB, glyoxalase superfamily n=1 Tax=Deinococcus hopiensis KR-140 TaxID=695939 RepID=A0A1W1V521_9DEIO|nr:VOC family protein [Deinococcus hopiensis]SMB88383.1 Uncharacterized conserved protein PhnB, glyoxalase superfamily [Deinococcus hopiensis KR-140]